MRYFLEKARERGLLVEIAREVDPVLEAANVISALDGRPVLLHNVRGSEHRLLAGMCSAREHFSMGLGIEPEQLLPALLDALEHPQAPPLVEAGACREVVEQDVTLSGLPILTHLPGDPGPYLTAAIVVVNDPDHGRNLSYHRMLVIGERELVARVVERRGLHTAWTKTGGDLPVAICVGNSMATLLAASMSPPPGIDELAIAHRLRPTPTVRCVTNDLEVPAEAEFVLEGRMTKRMADEGPFLDLTETLDHVRQQPVIEIDCITHRHDAVYQALLPGGLEHKWLMGMPREPTIFAAVNQVCRCKQVIITPGGASWLHAVVQIEKAGPDDGRQAIMAALRGHGSLKHVVVVDDDVDPANPAEVEWAIATRFQADRDLIVLPDEPGSSLDPSGHHPPGHKSRTAKMGLDATIPWDRPRQEFLRVRYQPVDLSRYLP
jgi:2,5-furandicarboxylate decarboxylase 1